MNEPPTGFQSDLDEYKALKAKKVGTHTFAVILWIIGGLSAVMAVVEAMASMNRGKATGGGLFGSSVVVVALGFIVDKLHRIEHHLRSPEKDTKK